MTNQNHLTLDGVGPSCLPHLLGLILVWWEQEQEQRPQQCLSENCAACRSRSEDSHRSRLLPLRFQQLLQQNHGFSSDSGCLSLSLMSAMR